jgi:hypothetical protein
LPLLHAFDDDDDPLIRSEARRYLAECGYR